MSITVYWGKAKAAVVPYVSGSTLQQFGISLSGTSVVTAARTDLLFHPRLTNLHATV